MIHLFGDFTEEPDNDGKFLALGFLSNSISLKQRWRNNGLSADFMGDYLTNFFSNNEVDKKNEIKGAVAYIANEMLENAMKFNDESSNYPITIKLLLRDNHIYLYLTNSIPIQNVSKFQAYIHKLSNSEPQELYIEQIEQNAQDETGKLSSLGILTMINDYMAKIGWKFETLSIKLVVVTTMVKILI